MHNPWADTNDNEVDIAAPAWKQWDSGNDSLSLWGAPAVTDDKEWHSSYESIRFAQPQPDSEPKAPPEIEQEQGQEQEEEEEEEQEKEEEQSITPVDPWTPAASTFPVSEEPDRRSPSPSRPQSPDAFGTFEVGVESEKAEIDPWTPAQPGENAWGAAWAPSEPESTGAEDEDEDEWEAAKRQKQIQDRYVPPELLDSILKELEQVSRELWPPEDKPQDEQSASWKDGMEQVDGLTSLADQVIPRELSIPTIPPFPKTFVSKRIADAVRLTRNVQITRMGPMSKYLATKGSTAWEASVKARPEVVPDNVLPAGWRIVEKKEESPATLVESKKKTGILSSFFSRRASTPPTNDSRSDSPRNSTGSPRPSIDSVAKSKTSSPVATTPVASPTTSTPPVASIPVATLPAAISSSSSSTTASTTVVESPDLFPEAPPPPSAVSRFLNRFSRTKSSPQHSSLALSTDDLDLLSDIVPSASDDTEDPPETDPHLKALSNMIASAPLSDKLPPPLAPPPKPAPIPKLSTNPVPTSTNLGRLIPPLKPVPTSSNATLSIRTPTSSSPSSGNDSVTSTSTPTEKKMNAFIFPPPKTTSSAASRKTPVAIMSSGTSFSNPSVSGSSFGFLPPPPAAPARSSPSTLISTAVKTNTADNMLSFDDNDDEFSDFHSSSYSSPPPTSRPLNSSQHDSPSSVTSLSSSLSGSVHQGLFSNHRHQPSFNSVDLLKDDFDDFVSGPSNRGLRTPSPPRPLAKSPGRPPPLLDSFQNDPLSPPTTSARLPAATAPIPPPHILAVKQKKQVEEQQRQIAHNRKPSREAEHQRTRSLMENAVAQRGARWPRPSGADGAPPSPLPPILSPPPGGGGHQNQNQRDEIDFFGAFEDAMTPVTPTTARAVSGTTGTGTGMRPSISSPAQLGTAVPVPFNLQPPPVRKGTIPLAPIPGSPAPTMGTFQLSPPPPPPASAPALASAPTSAPMPLNFGTSVLQAQKPASGGTVKTGGLSAQDLSFFEGL
ncbi:hypothetical protein K435DRAFT_232542 [Dendrothele bispora CBS 962.96]|uniref:Uncharacterized protein n=1 Tax=Dendrothele bispora (strain CBS 962.96) TaxID=1314807 RepID=A0A4S8LQA5_DENBC|nr:hypothetical protein K435DRAFT_232542 [Dendrothele bispora CBS 962.96]